jgi:hypothetical protein
MTDIIEFLMNNPIEAFLIGTIAFAIAGVIMRAVNESFDIWLGKAGGSLLWFVVALFLSSIYHWVL